jgi:hypothetical protein
MADKTQQLEPPPVASIPQSSGEKFASGIGGMLSAGTGQQFQGSDLQQAIEKHHAQRLEEARMNAETASRNWAILQHGVDPDTNQPFEKLPPEVKQRYQTRFETSQAAYEKAAGVNKDAKNIIQRGKILLQHIGNRIQQQKGQGGMPPPPTPQASAPQEPGSGMAPGGIPPPPQPTAASKPPVQPDTTIQDMVDKRNFDESEGTQSALRQRGIVAKAAGITPDSPEFKEFMATGKFPTSYGKPGSPKMYTDPDGTPFMGIPDETGQIVSTQTGQVVPGALTATPGAFTPKRFNYMGADGKPQIGYQIGRKFYSIDGKELPMGTEAFSAWMTPKFTESHTLKEVTQPDGSIELVPVTTSSVTTRGNPGGPAASPQTPPPSGSKSSGAGKSSSSAPATNPMGTHGKVVGGKVPPGVAKAYESYNSAQERYAVMEAALPDARKGDQQAELNLLANHIGMTMGLQKGSRITQSIYNEAAESAPWLQRVEAHFDKDGYLTGVVLTPEQMEQMIKLAKVRLEEDRKAWQREIDAAKSGYGMTPDKGASAPASKGLTPPPATTPKTADEYLQSIGVH